VHFSKICLNYIAAWEREAHTSFKVIHEGFIV